MRRIILASDHAGVRLKAAVKQFLTEAGYAVQDIGTHSETPMDYPDITAEAARCILRQEADRGIVMCGSGVGASIAANKISGIRAAVCHDTYSARQGVEHDDMNVLCLGSRIIGEQLAGELVRAFANARFSGEERHVRRLQKVAALEQAQHAEIASGTEGESLKK